MLDMSTMREAAARYPDRIAAPYDEIYRAGGFDALLAMFDALGGKTLYVPSLRTALAGCLEAGAREEREARAATHGAIARKYGFSDRHMRKLARGR